MDKICTQYSPFSTEPIHFGQFFEEKRKKKCWNERNGIIGKYLQQIWYGDRWNNEQQNKSNGCLKGKCVIFSTWLNTKCNKEKLFETFNFDDSIFGSRFDSNFIDYFWWYLYYLIHAGYIAHTRILYYGEKEG